MRRIGQGHTALRHLYKEELLAFFRFGNMGRHKWILCARVGGRAVDDNMTGIENPTHHEGFKVGPPPLGKTVTDFPVIVNPVGGIELAGVTRRC